MFGSIPFGPMGHIPGQAPRLIHRLRHQPRIDTSAFSRLSRMPEVTNELQPVGNLGGPKINGQLHGRVPSPVADMPVRHPEQVAAGLGLPFDAERDLTQQVQEWIEAPDPVSFRRSLFKGLRSFAPGDYSKRNEIAKRVMSLWKSRVRSSPYDRDCRNVVVQKSARLEDLSAAETHREPPLEFRRQMRLTIARPQPMELVWMTRELDEIGDQPPPLGDGDAYGKWYADQMGRYGEEIARQSGEPSLVIKAKPKPIYSSKQEFLDRIKAAGLDPTGVNLDAINALLGVWSIPDRVIKAERDLVGKTIEQVAKEHAELIREAARAWRERRFGLAKAAGHKYIKRLRRPNPPPKYRYWYKVPQKKGLTSSEDIQEGARFKAAHRGTEGHFEVVRHHKKGVVEVKHDESGRTAFVKERDLHRMVSSYHSKKTAEAKKKPAPKAPKKLKTVTLKDFQNGEYDEVEGFGTPADLEVQAAAGPKDREYAIIKQPGGHMLVSKYKREAGKKREYKGEKIDLKLRSGKGIENLKAEFVLVEADDLVASHKPNALNDFPVNPDYPENVQERRYHAIGAEQEKVDRIAKGLDPAILVNTNPDAVNGAPIMDQNNAIIGGNGRTMAIQMAYAQYPDSAKKMKDYLVANARKYGFAAADVRTMKQPALVRRVQAEPGKDNKNLKMLGRRMNEALTQGLDPRSEEVSVSQFVTENVCQSLVDAIEPGQTLADFLHSSSAEGFVVSLRQAGIIDELNKAQYLEHDKEGKAIDRLNEDGRNRVERVMAARLIPDADLLQKMNPELRKALALSTPSIIVAEQHGWPISTSLRMAIEADIHIREQFKGKKASAALFEFFAQTEATAWGVDVAERLRADPVAQNLLHVIRGKVGPKMTPRDFRGFAARAVQDYNDHAFSEERKQVSGTLLGMARSRVTPADALDLEFGITPERKAAKKQKIAEEKELAAAQKKAEAERKRLARLQSESQSMLFAASEYLQEPDLVKAMTGSNRLMNRAIWHTQYLVDAAIHHSTSTSSSRKPRVNVPKIVAQVMEDVRSAVKKDPAYARDLGAQPITEAMIRGLIESMTAMTSLEVIKSMPRGELRKAIETAPPPPPKKATKRRKGWLARLARA